MGSFNSKQVNNTSYEKDKLNDDDDEKKLLNEFDNLKNDTTLNIVDRLQKQLLLLENIYTISGRRQDELNKKIISLQNSKIILENKEHLISEEKISEYIDNMLSNDNVNIKILPDFAEKQIYKNMLNLIINMLNNTLENTSFKFLGHELIIVIKPDY